MDSWVGDGGVGLTTEQVGGRMLFSNKTAHPRTHVLAPCLALSLGPSMERAGAFQTLRVPSGLGTSRGRSQGREMALPEKGPERAELNKAHTVGTQRELVWHWFDRD